MIKSIKDNFNKELHVRILNLIENRNFEEASNLVDLNLTDKTRIDYKNKLKAFIFLKKQEWKTSLNFYQKISEDSLDFETLNNYGIVLFKLGHFLKAAEKFEKSLSKNKNYIPSYENLVISHKLIGNYDISIKYILEVLKIDPSNIRLKNHLIDILNFHETKENENEIFEINNEIKAQKILYKNNIELENKILKEILERSEQILSGKKVDLNYPQTQIYRRNELNLNCDRHLDIFKKHQIIPKYCFSCFKVQITVKNVKDLVKLYFYFNKANFKENNIRKCVVELRKKIKGNYKGYIFSQSLRDAEQIIKLTIQDLSKIPIIPEKIEIKHGCTEYYEKYKNYKNLDASSFHNIYKEKWEDIEKQYDKLNFIKENNEQKIFNKTLNQFNLTDFLIIKNWFLYAKLINDNTYKEIYNFDINTNLLSEIEKEQISSRIKNN